MTHDGSAMSRLWLIWVVGLAAYLVGVMQRTSFGIAGLDAAARFDASPAVLSGFVVLQLLVYASLQVPAGVLLDRFGARTLVVVGALVMAAGQLLLALAARCARPAARGDPARGAAEPRARLAGARHPAGPL